MTTACREKWSISSGAATSTQPASTSCRGVNRLLSCDDILRAHHVRPIGEGGGQRAAGHARRGHAAGMSGNRGTRKQDDGSNNTMSTSALTPGPGIFRSSPKLAMKLVQATNKLTKLTNQQKSSQNSQCSQSLHNAHKALGSLGAAKPESCSCPNGSCPRQTNTNKYSDDDLTS